MSRLGAVGAERRGRLVRGLFGWSTRVPGRNHVDGQRQSGKSFDISKHKIWNRMSLGCHFCLPAGRKDVRLQRRSAQPRLPPGSTQSPGCEVAQPRPGWHRWQTPVGHVYIQGPKRCLPDAGRAALVQHCQEADERLRAVPLDAPGDNLATATFIAAMIETVSRRRVQAQAADWGKVRPARPPRRGQRVTGWREALGEPDIASSGRLR
jgi:hypothetical protein